MSIQQERVDCNSPIPPNWNRFLQSEQNKDELFNYLANCIQSFSDHGKFLISTVGKIVVNVWQIDFQDFKSLQPCSHKETDTRILLHVA